MRRRRREEEEGEGSRRRREMKGRTARLGVTSVMLQQVGRFTSTEQGNTSGRSVGDLRWEGWEVGGGDGQSKFAFVTDLGDLLKEMHETERRGRRRGEERRGEENRGRCRQPRLASWSLRMLSWRPW